jgi:hypothetical protein
MTRENKTSSPAARHDIDTRVEGDLREWARKLDATPQQIKDAVDTVGPKADDVEMHLKGSRSTTNSERSGAASGSSPAPGRGRSSERR